MAKTCKTSKIKEMIWIGIFDDVEIETLTFLTAKTDHNKCQLLFKDIVFAFYEVHVRDKKSHIVK